MTAYDKYITNGNYHSENLMSICQNGHTWMVEGYSEYGGWWANNENDYFCPQCSDEMLDYIQVKEHGLKEYLSQAEKEYNAIEWAKYQNKIKEYMATHPGVNREEAELAVFY